MSRSRRHTPVTGITTSERDTRDTGLAHRRQQRRGRPALASGREDIATRRTSGDVWRVAKDGKPRVDPQRRTKLMRT